MSDPRRAGTDFELAEDLRVLLREERKALLNADFPTLSRIAGQKAAMLEHPVAFSGELGAELRKAAVENHQLLEASRDGLLRAQYRLAQIAASVRGCMTYGADGQALPIQFASVSVERRA